MSGPKEILVILKKKYKSTAGVFDPSLYPGVAREIRKECLGNKVKCSKRDAELAARVLLQVSCDEESEPQFCGKGRWRMLSDAEAQRLEDIFAVFMWPNITSPIEDSAYWLCNKMLHDGKGFKRTVRHGRSHIQVFGPDMSLDSAPPVLLVLK